MKKIIMLLTAMTLFFTPVGSVVFQDGPSIADAKRSFGGSSSFNKNSGTSSSFLNKSNTTNTNTLNKSKMSNTFNKMKNSSLMKGLFFGGLAGLLLGGLFGQLGMMGPILGFLLNLVAIIALFAIAGKIYSVIKKKRREKELETWGK